MPLLLLAVYLTVNFLKIEDFYTPIGEGYCSFQSKDDVYFTVELAFVTNICLLFQKKATPN
jgi:hypothetical protein